MLFWDFIFKDPNSRDRPRLEFPRHWTRHGSSGSGFSSTTRTEESYMWCQRTGVPGRRADHEFAPKCRSGSERSQTRFESPPRTRFELESRTGFEFRQHHTVDLSQLEVTSVRGHPIELTYYGVSPNRADSIRVGSTLC